MRPLLADRGPRHGQRPARRLDGAVVRITRAQSGADDAILAELGYAPVEIGRLRVDRAARLGWEPQRDESMRIGKQDRNLTAIATSTPEQITIRGRDLCEELIGKIGFTDYFFFLVTGAMPTEVQRFFTDAVMVAIAEHGLVPSVQAGRMTLAAAPEAWQGAVAAGLLGVGSVVAGSSEAAGRYLAELIADAKAGGGSFEDAARASLIAMKAKGEKVPGIGHPQHSTGDPRANTLLALADKKGVSCDHVRMLRAVAILASEIMGRALPVNVSGAIPAIMLDIGYPLAAMKGLPLLARTAGLIAHLYEESQRSIGFIMSHQADIAIRYDGPPAKGDKHRG